MTARIALALLVMMGSAARADEPKIEGSLDKNMVKHVVKTKLSTLRQCYDDLLKADPKRKEVTVSVRFSIDGAGAVSEAELNEAVEVKFDACIVKTFKAMKFAGAGRTVIVNYPLVFRQ